MRILAIAAVAFAAIWVLPDLIPSGPTLNLDVAGTLNGGKLFLGILLVYLSGIGTSLTPCVYPLIPITLSVMGVKKDGGSRLGNIGLAAAYVGGMVVTYDVVGLALMLSNRAFGTLLANPAVVTPIAILFVVLSMPMFGIFEIGLPPGLQQRLSTVGGPGVIGSFAMGLVAGLVAAPCSGPVTALIAGVVSQSHDLVLGTGLMTAYAVGIGTLFFVLAAFSVKLPRSGSWMEMVKSTFGIALVVLALLYLKDAFPFARNALTSVGRTLVHIAPIAATVTALGVLLGALHRSFHDNSLERTLKGAGIALAVVGIFLRLGVNVPSIDVAEAKGNNNAPSSATGSSTTAQSNVVRFLSLEDGLKQAKSERKPLLIDFGAEWCAACKELERITYPAPEVRTEASRFVAVKVDGTDDTDEVEALYKQYGVAGLPTVVFINSTGEARNDLKLTGFEAPNKFVERLKKVQ
jgi:thiol:disulfide interchange protein DsbD